MTMNFLIFPDRTASRTVSLSPQRVAWLKPPTISMSSSCLGGVHFSACSMTAEKSFEPPLVLSGMCLTPSKPTTPVVYTLSLYLSSGGTRQFEVSITGPLNVSKSSICFHQELP